MICLVLKRGNWNKLFIFWWTSFMNDSPTSLSSSKNIIIVIIHCVFHIRIFVCIWLERKQEFEKKKVSISSVSEVMWLNGWKRRQKKFVVFLLSSHIWKIGWNIFFSFFSFISFYFFYFQAFVFFPISGNGWRNATICTPDHRIRMKWKKVTEIYCFLKNFYFLRIKIILLINLDIKYSFSMAWGQYKYFQKWKAVAQVLFIQNIQKCQVGIVLLWNSYFNLYHVAIYDNCS